MSVQLLSRKKQLCDQTLLLEAFKRMDKLVFLTINIVRIVIDLAFAKSCKQQILIKVKRQIAQGVEYDA